MYIKDVGHIKWHAWKQTYEWAYILNSNNVDSIVQILNKVLHQCFSLTPHDIIKRTENDKPWISNVIKVLNDERHKAYRKNNYSLYYHLKQKLNAKILK